MCGCETCLAIRFLQASLNAFQIEGSVVEFYPQEEREKIERGLATVQDIMPMMESHSHFSDDKWQNAMTTYLHMDTMLESLKK